MRRLVALALLCAPSLLATAAAAEKTAYPWVIVYQQMRCAPVAEIDASLRVELLLGEGKCEKEGYFGGDQVLSLGCEDTLGTGFIFARTRASCEAALAAMWEAMGRTPSESPRE